MWSNLCATLNYPKYINHNIYITTCSGSSHGLWSWFTYSMRQSPSWEDSSFSASQEIPCILWNLKIPYCIHKCLPAQSNPYPTSYFLKMNLSIILPSITVSSRWFLSLRFLHQNPQYASPRTCPTHFFLLDLMNKIIRLLLLDNIVRFKCDYTDKVINLTVCGVCNCTGLIYFLAAF